MSGKSSITEGGTFFALLRFALPLMAVNLLQVFYTSADMMIVGLSGVGDAVGAIGTTLPMINLIVNAFMGMSVGANVVLAGAIGAHDGEKAEKVLHTSLVFSVIIGILAALIGMAVSRPVLSAMGNRGELMNLSVKYSVIYFAGVPALSVTNFSAAMLRASGDSKSPLCIIGISGLFNVLFNLLFVLAFGMSVDGVALATVLANILSAILLIVRLAKRKTPYALRFSKLRLNKKALFSIVHIGVPAGLQSILFSVSHLLIQSSVLAVNNSIAGADAAYQPVVKGCSAATNLETFANTAVNAVTQAAITFIGQNAGAGNYKRCRRVRRSAYGLGFCTATLSAMLLLLLHKPLLALYGVTPGEDGTLERIAYESAAARMMIMMVPYFLLAFMETGSAIMQALSRPLTATAVSVCGSVLFRVLWIIFVFDAVPTLTVIFISYPISWLLTGTVHFIFGQREIKALEKKQAQQSSCLQ